MAGGRVQGYLDRSAQRVHDELAARPDSFSAAPSTAAAYALTGAVLAVSIVALAGLVWLTVSASAPWQWVVVAFGWALVVFTFPRPARIPSDVTVIDPDAHPNLRRLVEMISEAVDTKPPTLVGVDPGVNASVQAIGYGRRSLLTIGIPLWYSLDRPGRAFVIGHEIGHLRGTDTLAAVPVSAALRIVDTMAEVLRPAPDERYLTVKIIYGLLSTPFRALRVLYTRLVATSRQHREFLADRRAVHISGISAAERALALDPEGVWTWLNSAVLRGEDPAVALRDRKNLGLRDVEAAKRRSSREVVGAYDSHPPVRLRLSLLRTYPAITEVALPREVWAGAEAEMAVLADSVSGQIREAVRGRR